MVLLALGLAFSSLICSYLKRNRWILCLISTPGRDKFIRINGNGLSLSLSHGYLCLDQGVGFLST